MLFVTSSKVQPWSPCCWHGSVFIYNKKLLIFLVNRDLYHKSMKFHFYYPYHNYIFCRQDHHWGIKSHSSFHTFARISNCIYSHVQKVPEKLRKLGKICNHKWNFSRIYNQQLHYHYLHQLQTLREGLRKIPGN